MKNIRDQIQLFCGRIGGDPLLVQGAGGNISWKEGNVLWVKASGTRLADAQEEDIFVSVDLDHLKMAVGSGEFSLSPRVMDQNQQLRPSIETLLHAIMPQAVVLHLHAVEILAHLVRDDFEGSFANLLDSDIAWASIPYRKPGADLAQAVSEALECKPEASVLFLQNHGVVVGGSDIGEVERLLSRLVENLTTPVPPQQNMPMGGRVSRKLADAGYYVIEDDDIQCLAQNPKMFRKLQELWALYPDHVVFLGSAPNCYEDSDDLLSDTRRPECAFVKNDGVYATVTFNKTKQEQLRCYFDVLARQHEEAHLNVLSDEQVAELRDWEAEKYRMQIGH